MFTHQGVKERHLFSVFELHFHLGLVVQQDRLADADVARFAVLACNNRVEIDRADIALRRVVEIGLEKLVQMVGKEGRIRRGRLGVASVGIVAVKRLEQRFWRLVGLRQGGQGRKGRDSEGEDEYGQTHAALLGWVENHSGNGRRRGAAFSEGVRMARPSCRFRGVKLFFPACFSRSVRPAIGLPPRIPNGRGMPASAQLTHC
ncbi:hypothetical protein RHE_CH02567 [Rhizobium etli CFN 42]|uniref:Uncharacterized protein n=1 Tax=Rhizobium etli (strain ATCC 51251 / DSM 11541 / JCM 21823 / NBRC 15573 / CFN 42) TaxID=347834 RepID=Q2K745_RHIEC|nr:hypothetical protein RHE_CH02567 [Rhizobium etli CFN 42]